ncbi:hypothetical protein EXIGLDRAFT_841816 [Exidia glandulosa HHB12029]|uniref:non-reducing end alpha-L-arabinofuranosidase n=1 Tax=Exidia glandulosa HHB12029 TaxID=1314781 RepID=A0A165ZQJ0_EXIGL|nr:hypothetical protein EXIGLDRAFT_841816 [Exidia glandulosa HHB12029]
MLLGRVVVVLSATHRYARALTYTVDAITPQLTTAWSFSGVYRPITPLANGCSSQPYAMALYSGAEASLTLDGQQSAIHWFEYVLQDLGISATYSLYNGDSLVKQATVNSSYLGRAACEQAQFQTLSGVTASTTLKITVAGSGASTSDSTPLVDQPQFQLTAAFIDVPEVGIPPSTHAIATATPTTPVGSLSTTSARSISETVSNEGAASSPFPPAQQTQDVQHRKKNVAPIVGAVIGVVLIAILVCCFLLWRKHRHRGHGVRPAVFDPEDDHMAYAHQEPNVAVSPFVAERSQGPSIPVGDSKSSARNMMSSASAYPESSSVPSRSTNASMLFSPSNSGGSGTTYLIINTNHDALDAPPEYGSVIAAKALQNRAFQGQVPGTEDALNAWSAVGASTIRVVNESTTASVSPQLPNSLQVVIPSNARGPAGFANSGFWGIKVTRGAKYTASFYAKVVSGKAPSSSLTVSLVGASSGTIFGKATVRGSLTTHWQQFTVSFTPSRTAPDGNNLFTVTLDGAGARGADLAFALISLFPPTFKNRPNGMRVDIAEALADAKPSFWRFPGGCDFLSSAPASYEGYRWAAFANAIRSEFPHIKIMSTDLYGAPLDPAPKFVDAHVYQTPEYFASNNALYSNRTAFPLNGAHIFEGEYAVTSTNASCLFGDVSCGRLPFPTLRGSISEAVFMAGLERDSDLVFAASYAPLLNHINSTQWTPDLVAYDATRVFLSTSYFVQKMFSVNRGDRILVVHNTTSQDPLFWVAAQNTKSKQVFVKLVNIGATAQKLPLAFSDLFIKSHATATTLTHSNFNISNTPDAPNNIAPVTTNFRAGSTFTYTVPGQALVVLALEYA